MSDDFQRLLNDSFRFLSFRPRSKQEVTVYVESRVKLKKMDPAMVEQVLKRLTEMDYLDDTKFAHEWVESRLRSRGFGPARLRQELRQKGISRDIIDEVTNTKILGSQSQYEIAKQLLEKHIALWQKLPFLVLKRKIYEFFVRRGFSSSVALRLIDEYVAKAYNTGCENND